MKDSVEVRSPACNRFLVVPCVEESRDAVSLALFDNLSLYLCNSPTIKNVVGVSYRSAYHWSNSPRQLTDGIAYGLVEILQLLSAHSAQGLDRYRRRLARVQHNLFR